MSGGEKNGGKVKCWADGVFLYSWCYRAFGEVAEGGFVGTAVGFGVSQRKAGLAGEPRAALGGSWGIGWEGHRNWKRLGAVKGILSMKPWVFTSTVHCSICHPCSVRKQQWNSTSLDSLGTL